MIIITYNVTPKTAGEIYLASGVRNGIAGLQYHVDDRKLSLDDRRIIGTAWVDVNGRIVPRGTAGAVRVALFTEMIFHDVAGNVAGREEAYDAFLQACRASNP